MANYPVTYLYNDIPLPVLPEWNKKTYPYVLIYLNYIAGNYGGTYYYAVVSDIPFYWNVETINGTTIAGFDKTVKNWVRYEIPNDQESWTFKDSNNSALRPGVTDVVWSGYDFCNTDGTLYLAASKAANAETGEEIDYSPIPITPSNPFCLRSWLTGFALGLAGKSLPYSKVIREPVAYLYNGIRLPALPE